MQGIRTCNQRSATKSLSLRYNCKYHARHAHTVSHTYTHRSQRDKNQMRTRKGGLGAGAPLILKRSNGHLRLESPGFVRRGVKCTVVGYLAPALAAAGAGEGYGGVGAGLRTVCSHLPSPTGIQKQHNGPRAGGPPLEICVTLSPAQVVLEQQYNLGHVSPRQSSLTTVGFPVFQQEHATVHQERGPCRAYFMIYCSVLSRY